MARQTVRWRVAELLRLVAGQAFRIAMFAEQREARQSVIKEDVLGP